MGNAEMPTLNKQVKTVQLQRLSEKTVGLTRHTYSCTLLKRQSDLTGNEPLEPSRNDLAEMRNQVTPKGPVTKTENTNPPLADLMLNPEWQAEFRGFFWGEGWLGITRFRGRKNGVSASNYTYRPEVNITQTVVNKDVVFHIKDVLGGFVYERAPYVHGSGEPKLRGPYYTWMSRSNLVSRRALECIDGGFFPDKKRNAVVAFRRFLDILDEWGGLTKPPVVLDEIELLRSQIHPGLGGGGRT